jgi:hypothetical protein
MSSEVGTIFNWELEDWWKPSFIILMSIPRSSHIASLDLGFSGM